MPNENKNININPNDAGAEQKIPSGWKDVVISADMPLSVLINFLNVVNQRLVVLENNTFMELDQPAESGETKKVRMSVTDFYQLQAELQRQAAESKGAQPDQPTAK